MSFYRITKEIYQVGGGRLTSHKDAAIYLMSIDGHAALVDAGCGDFTVRLIDNIRSCNIETGQIEYLLITHCHYDHAGGVKRLKEEIPNCVVVAHELDASYLEEGENIVTAARFYGAQIDPFFVDRKLAGPEGEIILGDRTIRAVHVPGHSPGSAAYIVESEGKRVLFGQDVHGPIEQALKSDRGAYKRSLEFLITLDADLLCEGHYGIIEGKEEVAVFIRSFL